MEQLIRNIETIGRIKQIDFDDQISNFVLASLDSDRKTAARLHPILNGRPRMLLIDAWIVHAGRPNKNREAFLAEDLEEAVKNGLFKPPYVGMIDFNHDFQTYGFWYDAKYAFDEVANEYGIFAEGAVFAWAYEGLADRALALQERNGGVKVSMTCLAQGSEDRADEDGAFTVLRQPVFFAASILDVPPAFPHTRGLVTESEEKKIENEQALMSAASLNVKEVVMNQEMIDKIKELLGAEFEQHSAEFSKAFEAVAKVVELEAQLAASQAAVAESEQKVLALETEKAEMKIALDAATEKADELTTQVQELSAFKESIEAAEAEKVLAEKRTARFALVNPTVLANIEKLEESVKTRMYDSWLEMSDEDFVAHVAAIGIGTEPRKTYVARSEEEGILPSFTDGTDREPRRFLIDEYFDK